MTTMFAPTDAAPLPPLPTAGRSLLAQFLATALPGRPKLPADVPPVHMSKAWPKVPVDRGQLLARVAKLPPLPEAVTAMLRALDNHNASIDECAELLRRDQALAARLLRLANSAFYGVPGRVASVHDAINLIGLRSLRSLVTTAGLTLQFDGHHSADFDLPVFWRHTVATAFAARAMAAQRGLDEELAYTAGLLHDVGRLALAAHFPRAYAAVLRAARESGQGGCRLEHAVMDTDHAEVGAAVALHWHLPVGVVEVIAQHHTPPAHSPACSLVDVVHVADALSHGLGFVHDGCAHGGPSVAPGPWQRVGLDRMPFDDILVQVDEAVSGTCQALGL